MGEIAKTAVATELMVRCNPWIARYPVRTRKALVDDQTGEGKAFVLKEPVDANAWSRPSAGRSRPPSDRNRCGSTLGRP